MLGLGQSDASLPVLMGMAAVTSCILTDYKRIIQLGDWTVNVFVICIFCFNVFDVWQHRGEDLAWSIARVLVFVQIVLLFREKETRFCWQILLISLLQAVVSTVFQQSIAFGTLLLLYVFVGLGAFILLFLQYEHRYFRQHSFVRTFSESVKAEMAERQDRRRLFRLALLTLLMGPLSLLLSFGKKKTEQTVTDQKNRTQEMLRSLFLIFPTEEDLAHKERWERVEDTLANESQSLAEPAFHVVPQRANGAGSSFAYKRFPLLTERPRFSAGTQNPQPWGGNWRELLVHLTWGTFFAFFMAVSIFCLVPRVGQIDFYNYTLKQDFERWVQPVRRHIDVGMLGINEEIQLGSLGSVIPYHREVMKVRFLHNSENTFVTDTDLLENQYQAIGGATLYFRGTPLDTYFDGAWTQSPVADLANSAALGTGTGLSGNPYPAISGATLHFRETPLDTSYDGARTQSPVAPPANLAALGMGSPLPSDRRRAFFASDCDFVTLVMNIQPLSTQVFFAPHPFFNANEPDEINLRSANGRIEEVRWRRWEATKTIATTVFQHGFQLDLVPCQEWIDRKKLLQVPDSGLEALQSLAVQWDAESQCTPSDIVGRARFMERQFLQSPEFSYQLGGTIRDYDLDPLEDFIAYNPRGHCEYFAGALALMLRSVGIGARVIIGFKTEAQGFNASCTIRQSDAHAWVEVYVPPETMPNRLIGPYRQWWQRGGWLRLDPTPASNDSTMMSALSLRWTDLRHVIQSFWNEYVLNMTQNRQAVWIYEPLYQAGQFIVHRLFNWEFWKEFGTDMLWYYRSFFSDTPQQERQMGDGFYLIPPFVILGLLSLACWRLTSMLLSSRKRTAEAMRRRITVEFYFRMESILAKLGHLRRIDVTPLEFARQSSFTPLMLPIVDAFYRVRFGGAVLSEAESKLIQQTLAQLETLTEPQA